MMTLVNLLWPKFDPTAGLQGFYPQTVTKSNLDRFQGELTAKIKKNTTNIASSETVTIGGFKWCLYVHYNEQTYIPLVVCNENVNNSIWLCKATCTLGFMRNGVRQDERKKYHNFCHAERELRFIQKYIESAGTNDNYLTISVTINVINQAGMRQFYPYDFSKPFAYSDVVLLVDKRRFHVNKAMLAMNSPFFETLFFSEFKEKEEKEIELKDIVANEFEELLNVIYPSAYPITDKNCEFLLKLADRLEIYSVMKVCEDFLCQSEHCGKMRSVKLADKYKLPRVITACVKGLGSPASIKHFAEMPGFNELSSVIRLEILEKTSHTLVALELEFKCY